MVKHNDRLERVQIGREKDIPLDTSRSLWFLIWYQDGEWDSENSLDVFIEDIKRGLVYQVFCVWHGVHRTNLFLMEQDFILDYFMSKDKK